MDPCTLCPATENHTKITFTYTPSQASWSFICIFKPDESIPLLQKMFLLDPLSSDPSICAWVSQLDSSLFVFWIKCYMHVLSLWRELQALCIQFSNISSSVNYVVKSKYKLLVTQMDKICAHTHTHTHTIRTHTICTHTIHTHTHTHIQPSQVLMTRKASCRDRWLPFTKICVA